MACLYKNNTSYFLRGKEKKPMFFDDEDGAATDGGGMTDMPMDGEEKKDGEGETGEEAGENM